MNNNIELTKKDIIIEKGKRIIRKELWDEWKDYVESEYEEENDTLYYILLDMLQSNIEEDFKKLSSLIQYQFKDMKEPKYIIDGGVKYRIIKNYLEIANLQLKFDSRDVHSMYDRIQLFKQSLEAGDVYEEVENGFYSDLPRLENLFEKLPSYVCRSTKDIHSARCAGFLTRFSTNGKEAYKYYIKNYLLNYQKKEIDIEDFNVFFEHAININRQSDINSIEQYMNRPECKLTDNQKEKIKMWISSEKSGFDKAKELYEFLGKDKQLDESDYDLIYLVGCSCKEPSDVLYILQTQCYHENVKLLHKLGLAILKRNEFFLGIEKNKNNKEDPSTEQR